MSAIPQTPDEERQAEPGGPRIDGDWNISPATILADGDWILSPATILAGILAASDLTAASLAAFGCLLDEDTVNGILHGSVRITGEIGAALAEAFGGTPERWVGFETAYRCALTRGQAESAGMSAGTARGHAAAADDPADLPSAGDLIRQALAGPGDSASLTRATVAVAMAALSFTEALHATAAFLTDTGDPYSHETLLTRAAELGTRHRVTGASRYMGERGLLKALGVPAGTFEEGSLFAAYDEAWRVTRQPGDHRDRN